MAINVGHDPSMDVIGAAAAYAGAGQYRQQQTENSFNQQRINLAAQAQAADQQRARANYDLDLYKFNTGIQANFAKDQLDFAQQDYMVGRRAQAQAELQGVELNQAEQMRMQRLQQADTAIQERVDNGYLTRDEGQNLQVQVRTGLNPLQQRAQQQQILTQKVQTEALRSQVQQQEALQQEAATFRARGLQDRVSTITNPETGETLQMFEESPGKWAPVPWSGGRGRGASAGQNAVTPQLTNTVIHGIETAMRAEVAANPQAFGGNEQGFNAELQARTSRRLAMLAPPQQQTQTPAMSPAAAQQVQPAPGVPDVRNITPQEQAQAMANVQQFGGQNANVPPQVDQQLAGLMAAYRGDQAAVATIGNMRTLISQYGADPSRYPPQIRALHERLQGELTRLDKNYRDAQDAMRPAVQAAREESSGAASPDTMRALARTLRIPESANEQSSDQRRIRDFVIAEPTARNVMMARELAALDNRDMPPRLQARRLELLNYFGLIRPAARGNPNALPVQPGAAGNRVNPNATPYLGGFPGFANPR